jgi:hypothetical protein
MHQHENEYKRISNDIGIKVGDKVTIEVQKIERDGV